MPAKTRKTEPRTRRETQIRADAETIRQAIEELGIDRPFYRCRVVGTRLEFSLYGGDLVYWPPKPKRKG
jgi:hypothetical protein